MSVKVDYMRTDSYRSDEFWRFGGSFFYFGLACFIESEVTEQLEGYYRVPYSMIHRANRVLDKIDAISFRNETIQKNLKGEALAFRAFAYWELGWRFGGVPLILTAMETDDVLRVKRSAQSETFAQVESDFIAAIQLLPESQTGTQAGRIDKYAAMAMLGRVYLFQGKYQEARNVLESVIHSGKYELETDYTNAFSEDHKNGIERVWEIQYLANTPGYGQSVTTSYLPDTYQLNALDLQSFAGSNLAHRVSEELMDAYEAGDLRKEISIVFDLPLNTGTTSEYAYIRKFHYAINKPAQNNYWGINIPIIRYADVKLMYAEALNQLGYIADGEAFEQLNDIRQRAGLSKLTGSDLPGKDAFQQAIIRERRVEFAFEGIRWMDLIRWGIAMDVMNTFLADVKQDGGANRMKPYNVLYPIPFREINAYNNPDIMWQNPVAE
ncbi:MAG: RagB/SusD family nutrient uptake outer membrane protein [Tannerella sp.]|nr:RagB/SusD family nutrient uptake outer membrane protein [Tannerella sp.]